MSSRVIEIRGDDDVTFKCLVNGQITWVQITHEAIAGCDLVDAEVYSEITPTDKEMIFAKMLVWLSNEEAHSRLSERYTIKYPQLDQLLRE